MALKSVLPETSIFPVSHHSIGTPHTTVIYDWKELTIGDYSHKVSSISPLLNKAKMMLTFLDSFHNCQRLTGLLAS
jgi:hypothetical protein